MFLFDLSKYFFSNFNSQGSSLTFLLFWIWMKIGPKLKYEHLQPNK
jgi:hypothetical protein